MSHSDVPVGGTEKFLVKFIIALVVIILLINYIASRNMDGIVVGQ